MIMPQQVAFHVLRRIRARLATLDGAAFAVFAGVCVLLVARTFYGRMHAETGGEWSAPLDDVFIHFDFARATARGYPFQWSEGNGYSSGNTSLSYPFVLAFGYWVGFRGMNLMLWAAIVACCSVYAFLLLTSRVAARLPRAAKYLLPMCVLSVGALDWSLFSGMEVAFFLCVWSVGLALALAVFRAPTPRLPRLGWALGLAGALIVGTRPEAATSVAVLGTAAAVMVWRTARPWKIALTTLMRAGAPGVLLLVAHSIANRVLTGLPMAAGSAVKLAYYNPFMSAQEKWDTYLFHLRYVVGRLLHHHFADVPPYGWIPVVLAVVALCSRRTRLYAIILLSSALSFLLLVAMNGQVRWQNERYAMPAVAWLMVAAALGLGVLLSPPRQKLHRWLRWAPRASLALLLASVFWIHQLPNMRDQIWFFSRASRNIRDQHITAGRLLRRLRPVPRRVLVGDAGAMMYASDLPGLDIIGLGGYHKLPFAQSSVHGLGATIELIERMPANELPDLFAIYPSWWGKLPIWFGRYIGEVPVEGNVICGGSEKVLYRADWRLLNSGAKPSTTSRAEHILDELDVADLLSEQSHDYEFPRPHAGWVDMRILSDPLNVARDVLDSGRRIPENRQERFKLRPQSGARAGRLLVRVAPVAAGRVEVIIDGQHAGMLELQPSQGWRELSVPFPGPIVAGQSYDVALIPREVSDWVHYHLWLVASP